MKKMVSLLLALIMVLSLGSVAMAEEPVTLTYLSIATGNEGEHFDKIIALFNESHPNVVIDRITVAGDSEAYYMKLSTMFASGEGPDIFDCSAAEFMKYVENGIAADLTEKINANRDDWFEAALEGVSIDGTVYAYPCFGGDLLGLYCNVDMFEAAGLELPTTWQETYDAAQKLATDTVYGIQIQTRDQNFYGGFEHYPFMWMGGGDLLSSDGKTVTVNSQATIDAFQFYRDLANSEGGNLTPETSNSDLTPFLTGRNAMQIMGSWGMYSLLNDEQYADLNWAVVPYPVPVEGMASCSDKGGWHTMVSSISKNADLALETADWIFNGPDTVELFAAHNSEMFKFNSRKSVLEKAEVFQTEEAKVWVEQIAPVAKMEPRYPSAVAKAYGEAFEKAIFEIDTPIADIVAELEQKCIEAIGQ